MHDRDGQLWFDGKLIPWRSATIHVLTHALHYGSGVFEGIRAYGGKIFKLAEHNQRLLDSARVMDIKIPYTLDEINLACIDAMQCNNIKDGYLRPIAWRGSEALGVTAQANKIHLAVAVWDWGSYFSAELREKGIILKTARWRRPPADCAPVHAKACGLYMICTLSKHDAERAGAHDALMLDYRGLVAEATGANIFFVTEAGEIHTPVADCFLNGITRQTVIDLARSHGFKLVERHIKPDEISSFRECFLTGTAAEVTAVGRIDDNAYAVGPVVRKLRDAYEQLVRV